MIRCSAVRSVLALGALACITAAPLSAQTSAQSSLSASDQAALRYTITDSVSEIDVCKLALSKTSSPAVRDFANAMISQHTQIEDQAQQLGRQMGVGIPLQESVEGPIDLAYLSKFSGKRFDEEFLHQQVEDHTNDISTLRNALQASQNDRVKDLLLPTIDKLDNHLRMANDAWNQISR